MGFIKEFKEFALRGNLIDFAIGVVMGGAFGKVTSAFVDGIVMPFVGKIIGGTDFSKMKWKIQDGTKEVMDSTGKIVSEKVDEIYISYGAFITTVLDFIIVAFVMFMVIKGMNAMKRKEEAAPSVPPAPTKEEVLLGEIRDLLKK